MKIEISTESIIERKMHIGHKKATLNPFMRQNMSRIKAAFTIFDTKKIRKSLENALEFLQENKDKTILFLFAKEKTRYIKEVIPSTSIFLFKWINGFFSNFDQVYKSITRLSQIKENAVFESKRQKHTFLRMNNQMCGLYNLTQKPDIIICTDAKYALPALIEAKQCGITSIAIVDSDVNPRIVDYPIICSDDRVEGILFVLQNIVESLSLIPNIISLSSSLDNKTEEENKKSTLEENNLL